MLDNFERQNFEDSEFHSEVYIIRSSCCVTHSHDVPLALMLVAGLDLVRLPPDFGVLVPAEGGDSIHNPLLEPGWAAIADDVEDPLPDPGVLVVDHLEDSVPEVVDVPLDLAWAELLDGLEPDVGVLVVGVLEDFVHVLGLTTDPLNIPLGEACNLLGLLLIV